MTSWIFGVMYGFARGANVTQMLNDETGFDLDHYEYGALHLAFYDLEFFTASDIFEHVGCLDLAEATAVMSSLIDKGLVECDKDGDFSLTEKGYEAQERINEVFEAIAGFVEVLETTRRAPTSRRKFSTN